MVSGVVMLIASFLPFYSIGATTDNSLGGDLNWSAWSNALSLFPLATLTALIVAGLAVQVAVVAALSPVLAGIGAVLIAGGGVLLLWQRRAFLSGHAVMRAGQSMMNNAASFLGGLKIAAAQRMRDRFVAEFAAAQTLGQPRGKAHDHRCLQPQPPAARSPRQVGRDPVQHIHPIQQMIEDLPQSRRFPVVP